MLLSSPSLLLCSLATLIIAVLGQGKRFPLPSMIEQWNDSLLLGGLERCEDYGADQGNCTKFIRCYDTFRIKFTCPSGTAWEKSLKTCVQADLVESCKQIQQHRRLGEWHSPSDCSFSLLFDSQLDESNETVTYEADLHALEEIPIGETLAEARSLGPMITPKQFYCSFCNTGTCGIVINAIQCVCGNNQCPPATTGKRKEFVAVKANVLPSLSLSSATTKSLCCQSLWVFKGLAIRLINAVRLGLNGGQCISAGAGFICSCPATFTGNRCEAPSKWFDSIMTVEDNFAPPWGIVSFVAVTPCSPSPCQNGGICIPMGSTFFCQCPSTFTGRCCESRAVTTTPFNPCAPSPCLNGGICIPTGNNFVCQCPSTFTGRCCESRVVTTTPFNPCAQSPCVNGGICIPIGNTYMCQCPSTFTGPACETRVTTTTPFNPCAQSPCLNGGICIPMGNTFMCQCPSTFTGFCCETRVTTTTPFNPCAQSPCVNGGICIPLGNTYMCQCPSTFTGPACETRVTTTTPFNPCAQSPCLNGGVCIPTGNTFMCQCPSTFTGFCCETRVTTTTPFNPCAQSPCVNGGICIPMGNTYMCQCPSTFTGPACETRVTTTTPFNPCAQSPCLNGGICIPMGTSFMCQCPSTFTGFCCENRVTTTTPFNPCAQSPCLNGGICIPMGTSFMCQCPSTFTGFCCENRVTTTTPFNACLQSPCQNGAQCIPTGNSKYFSPSMIQNQSSTPKGYLCQCPTGFYGTRCESRNYCMPNPCANNGLCTQTTTGYICACLEPYTGPNCNTCTSFGWIWFTFSLLTVALLSLVISTTVRTTVATRAPCGGGCGCVFTPCPTAVVVNPCVPNPWFVCLSFSLQWIRRGCFSSLVRTWVDVPFKILRRDVGAQTDFKATTANTVCSSSIGSFHSIRRSFF